MTERKEYSRYMSDFRGIDATNEASNIALNRFSYIQNMYKDYKSGQGVAIETFPGTRTLANFGGKINGIYSYKSNNDGELYVVVHAGTKLYRFAHANRDGIEKTDPIYDGMADNKSQGFIYNNRLYIIDGEHYIFVDEEGKAHEVAEEAYIPTTYTNGEQYEQRNMLTDKFVEKKFVTTLEESIDEGAFVSSDGEWEYDGLKYGVICAELCETYSSSVDEFNEYYYVDGSKWVENISCNFDVERVKIDFSKIVVKKYEEDNWDLFEELPPLATTTVNADGAAKPSDYYMNTFGGDTSKTPDERKLLLQRVVLAERVEVLEGTFDGCENLSELILSNHIKSLEARFFANTTNLKKIYLPVFLEELGDEAFDGCADDVTIYASKAMYEVLTEEGAAEKFKIPEGATITTYKREGMEGSPAPDFYNGKNRIYVYSSCIRIDKVLRGEKELSKYGSGDELTYQPVYKIVGEVEYIIAIELKCKEEMDINDHIFIHGESSPSRFTSATKEFLNKRSEVPYDETDDSIKGSNPDYKGTAVEAIKHCSICATFDDRIFFTGNPELPNTVFYTQRDLTGHNNPLYVGVLNYFNDGVGNTPNVAMMANASTLMVLKGNTLQDGSIFYHVGADGGNDLTPRIYPSTEGLAGLGCVGLAVNFRDDCVFMSSHGLEAIAKQTVNLERTIEHRSTNIDGLLLQSNLANARAAEWEGYLCILVGGKMYLADSRQMFEGIGGAIEYEWYYVDPVCGYNNYKGPEARSYKWSELSNVGYELLEQIKAQHGRDIGIYDSSTDGVFNAPDGKSVKSLTLDDGTDYFFQSVGDKDYLVDWDGASYLYTDEYKDPACDIFNVEDVLYFGTVGGSLLCLNADKRGEDPEEPDKTRIPSRYYNNSGGGYEAVAVFAMENAGVPHYTKTTVKRGTVLRLKSFPRSHVDIYASTDRQALTLIANCSNSLTVFDDFDFENIGLLTNDSNILAIKEKTKKWVEKQYMITSGAYSMNRPFGIYSLTYRYVIAGSVKNQ